MRSVTRRRGPSAVPCQFSGEVPAAFFGDLGNREFHGGCRSAQVHFARKLNEKLRDYSSIAPPSPRRCSRKPMPRSARARR
ncbi:hypothetical protein ACFPRL_12935 [Pseudoclavibacter helvolus]